MYSISNLLIRTIFCLVIFVLTFHYLLVADNKNFEIIHYYIFGLFPFVYFFSNVILGMLNLKQTIVVRFLKRSVSWLLIFLFFEGVAFLTNTGEDISRLRFGFAALGSFTCDLLALLITKFWYEKIIHKDSVILISDRGHEDNIIKDLKLDYNLVNVSSVDDDYRQIIIDFQPQLIVVRTKLKKISYIEKIQNFTVGMQSKVLWIPNLGEDVFSFDLVDFTERKGFDLHSSKISNNLLNIFAKRVFDFTGSLLLLTIFLPVIILVSASIKLSSKGPVFYVQKRHGLNGKKFDMFKFRSMYIDNGDFLAATKNDKRVTSIGKFIRKYSIDELPQLLNVLIGNMSLVGPRPHPIEMNSFYENKIENYMSRHRIKPGMTGLAQVNGYRGGDTPELIKKRVYYDLKYIREWSITSDVIILLRTPASLFQKGIY